MKDFFNAIDLFYPWIEGANYRERHLFVMATYLALVAHVSTMIIMLAVYAVPYHTGMLIGGAISVMFYIFSTMLWSYARKQMDVRHKG